jgi:hypothetical protein
MSKEQAYDDHVSPLMAQVIALCKEHKINMAAQFALDCDGDNGPLYCTTILHDVDKDDERGIERMRQCRRVMYPSAPVFAFMTVGGKP